MNQKNNWYYLDVAKPKKQSCKGVVTVQPFTSLKPITGYQIIYSWETRKEH